MLTAVDGSILETADAPSGRYPQVSVGSGVEPAGSSVDPIARGAVQFVAELPDHYRSAALVTGSRTDLTAHVAGHAVALGHPVDMGEKARTLAALLDSGVMRSAPINLVSPLRPAVITPPAMNPQAEVEGSATDPPQPEPTG